MPAKKPKSKPTLAAQVIEFAECLNNPDGSPCRLMAWQKDLLRETFSTDSQGNRTVRRAFLTCARQQGKTFIAAIILLYALYCMSPGTDSCSCAGDKEQASILYRYAKSLIEATPELAAITTFTDSKRTITNRKTGSTYRALSAEGGLAHGHRFAVAFVDELHVFHGQKAEELWSAVTTSMGAVKDSLIFITTTAANRAAGLAWTEYEYANRINKGVIKDPTYRAFIYECFPDDDIADPATWRKANPGLGVSKQLAYMQAAAQRAANNPRERNQFLRLDLNVWNIGTESAWIRLEDWDDCAATINWDDFDGSEAYLSLDLSSTKDLTAAALIFPHDGRFYLKTHFWMPKDNIMDRAVQDQVPYDVWFRQGHLTATPGNYVDYAYVERWILEQAERYEILEIPLDSHNAQRLSTVLTNHGLTCVSVSQQFAGMSEPSKFFEKLILAKELVHDASPVMRHHVDCVRIKQDNIDRIKPVKPDRLKSTSRIDGVAATVTGFARAMLHDLRKTNAWDGSGYIV